MKIKTVPYKGSKRKLLDDIFNLINEDEKIIFDGFSGTGIVSAYLRSRGKTVIANDSSSSSALYTRVFLEGFDKEKVENIITILNSLEPKNGWIFENYSGEIKRNVRGSGLKVRPLGFSISNAQKIDAARDWLEEQNLDNKEKNACIFSIILAANKVFNNSSDQKSAFRDWSPQSKKDIIFEVPTLISGPVGTVLEENILDIKNINCDVVYLDPPYTHGVLYPACYHINDSIVLWDKPEVDKSYALPRPERAIFRESRGGSFYSKRHIEEDFRYLLKKVSNSKKIILSYSDAPRNTIKLQDLTEICKEFGSIKVKQREHRICSQPNMMKKISKELNEYFIVIRT